MTPDERLLVRAWRSSGWMDKVEAADHLTVAKRLDAARRNPHAGVNGLEQAIRAEMNRLRADGLIAGERGNAPVDPGPPEEPGPPVDPGKP